MTLLIREFCVGDELELSRVFQSSIRELACVDYTAEQIEAWVGASLNLELWVMRMRELKPFVVEVNGVIAAYGDLQDHGYNDHFFVSGMYCRQGLGSMLMNRIIEKAITKGISAIAADVSRTAQRLFSRFGFVLVEQRAKTIRDVVIPNTLMCCDIFIFRKNEQKKILNQDSINLIFYKSCCYFLQLTASPNSLSDNFGASSRIKSIVY